MAADSELWLIRHGQSVANAQGVMQGQHDAPLSARGRSQAQRLARRLAHDPPDALWSSDLSRARDTAQAIADACALPLQIDPALREIDVGSWSNRPWREIERAHPAQWAQYRAGDPTFRRGGGECAHDVQARMVAAIERIVRAHRHQRVAIVSHGFAIRVYLAHLLDLPLAKLYRHFTLENSAIARLHPPLDGAPGTLLTLNDTCHLHAPDDPQD